MKNKTWMLLILFALVVGCGDETPIEVRIVSVWTADDYARALPAAGTVPYPQTVVERTDTRERIHLRGSRWGATGDVFTVKQCDLHWE